MKDIITSIRRSPYQSLTSFLVLFFALFLSTSLFISLSFLYGILGYIETKPQVTVYFQTKTSQESIFKIREDLINSGKVLSIKYISKDDAFKIYKDINKNNPLLIEMVSADILPSSLEIYAKKPIFLPEIAAYLNKLPEKDEVQYQKDIVDKLLTLTTILRKTTIIFFSYLILMSIIVLTTTTMFKIALKKDEIELLRLLGASNFYIMKPFLFESLLLGFIAAITSSGILLGLLLYIDPFLSSYLQGIPTIMLNLNSFQLPVWPLNIQFVSITFALSAFFGMSIAAIASLFATQKYLKN
ncbi:MAG: permease-like cell division protein FtsX [bacterium]|nr:permease-like cell division protein FtsX [bacterium]